MRGNRNPFLENNSSKSKDRNNLKAKVVNFVMISNQKKSN
jgi:hypothetical protein